MNYVACLTVLKRNYSGSKIFDCIQNYLRRLEKNSSSPMNIIFTYYVQYLGINEKLILSKNLLFRQRVQITQKPIPNKSFKIRFKSFFLHFKRFSRPSNTSQNSDNRSRKFKMNSLFKFYCTYIVGNFWILVFEYSSFFDLNKNK